MDSGALNLTRKWRSKNFDQVIGQELPIRMLKNSLYRNQFFPVYLFSGQRGCGKTSTARIFATAVNCQVLQEFQENPKNRAIPCLTCTSCLAMSAGRHPDFFEMDAASHTGVDTVRQLIDASQLLPVMGNKKIYLIDEAHMLSKASFNALLKILEEPPRSVLFMLATTDIHKIIDTIRSRCFQLFFTAVSQNHLHQHLVTVCMKEGIITDDQALQRIALHADGSMRDALNLLEQVRFSSGKVTEQAVHMILGYLDDEQVVTLFEKICTVSPTALLSYMQDIRLEAYCPERVWERLITCVRVALWIKHGAKPQQYLQYESRIKHIVIQAWESVSRLCERLHAEHIFFQKTTAKYALLEMIFLQICSINGSTTTGTAGAAAQVAPGTSAMQDTAHLMGADESEHVYEDAREVQESEAATLWSRFVRDSERLGDPLLKSVFQQGRCVRYKNFELTVEFSKKFIFFQDLLTNAEATWSPLLRALFGQKVTLKIVFTAVDMQKEPGQITKPSTIHKTVVSADGKKEVVLDMTGISAQDWPVSRLLINQFPGTITEIGI